MLLDVTLDQGYLEVVGWVLVEGEEYEPEFSVTEWYCEGLKMCVTTIPDNLAEELIEIAQDEYTERAS